MGPRLFIVRKEKLKKIAAEEKKKNVDPKKRHSIERLLQLLDMYNYDNRLKVKGLLAHTIVDSLEISFSLGENCIQFDNSIR